MDLKIGDIIRQRRKILGMGQEELANAVGISVPAVSKWECGKAYPDITLLPIIAKTLKTSVDSLFSYPAALSEEEIDKMVTACSEAFDKGGFEQGYAMLQQYLADNPDDVLLKCSMGTILSMYPGKYPEGQRDNYLGIAIDLCKPASESDNPKWLRMAQKMLTSLYIMNDQLDLAEESLHKYIDKEEAAANQTLAAIHLRKGELDKAEEIYQRSLFQNANECESALNGLASIAGTNKYDALFLDLEKKILELTKVLELDNFPGKGLNPYISLCYYYGKKEMTDEMLWALRGLAQSLAVWNSPFDSSKSKLYSHISLGDSMTFGNSMYDAVLKIAGEFKGYVFIESNPKFQKLIEQIENTLPADD